MTFRVNRYEICVSQMTVPSLLHDKLPVGNKRIRRVPLVGQELLTLPEHMSSPRFSGVCVAQSFASCIVLCRPPFCHFVLFLLYSLLFALQFLTHLISSNFTYMHAVFT
jgi:hypothetical protein